MDRFYLLDSRAGLLAVENDGALDTPDNDKYVLFAGTLKECCKYANNGEYGNLNVVSDDRYNIKWELHNEHGHWVYKNYKQ